MSKNVSTKDTKIPDEVAELGHQMHANPVGAANPDGSIDKPTSYSNSESTNSSNSSSNSTIASASGSATNSSTSEENQMDNSDLLSNGDRKVIVKEGDSIYSIAQEYHVGLQQLRFYNHVNKRTMKVRIGQEILIPDHFVSIPVGK